MCRDPIATIWKADVRLGWSEEVCDFDSTLLWSFECCTLGLVLLGSVPLFLPSNLYPRSNHSPNACFESSAPKELVKESNLKQLNAFSISSNSHLLTT